MRMPYRCCKMKAIVLNELQYILFLFGTLSIGFLMGFMATNFYQIIGALSLPMLAGFGFRRLLQKNIKVRD